MSFLNHFDLTTWSLWLVLPAMRYLIIPTLTDLRIGSYFIMVPIYFSGIFATVYGLEPAIERVTETLIGGGVLMLMLSIDLWREYNAKKVLYQYAHSFNIGLPYNQKLLD